MPKLNNLYFTGLFLMAGLTACQQTSGGEVLQYGDQIGESLRTDQDSIFLPSATGEAGLQITGERIRLDLGGAVLYGGAFGQVPGAQQGTAIEADRMEKFHLRKATFRGFRTGIKIGSVDTLILEDCDFAHFYRSMEDRPASAALSVKRAGVILLRGCQFRGMDRALQIGSADRIEVDSCHFQWINATALTGEEVEEVTIRQSTLLAIGPEDGGRPVVDVPGATLHLKNNHLAQVNTDEKLRRPLSENTNVFAYLPGLEAVDSNQAVLDRLLLESGIPTPGLYLYDEWGWYEFSYPRAWYRQARVLEDVYLLCAPPGNWRLIGGDGYQRVVPKTGTFPVTVRAERNNPADSMFLQFEYLGKPLRRHGVLEKTTESVTFRASPQ